MSSIEWYETPVDVEWHAPRAEIEGTTLEPGQYAISVGNGGGGMAIFTGTPENIAITVENFLIAAGNISDHGAQPLAFGDFEVDDEGDYACPRCTATFSSYDVENLSQLLAAVEQHIASHRPTHDS